MLIMFIYWAEVYRLKKKNKGAIAVASKEI